LKSQALDIGRGRNQGQAEQNPAMRGVHDEPVAGSHPISDEAAFEAKKQYDLGTWHRLRGEDDVALLRYREALQISPEFTAARNDLAALLVLRGQLAEAETEYRRVLTTEAKHRPALKGLALVQAKRGSYRSAHSTLQTLLLIDPNDAETWLHFGDVSMFMGDRPAALEAWTKSRDLESKPTKTKTRAENRLDIYRIRQEFEDPAVTRD
jgi:Flp pilus assembly protein TadD